MERCAGAGIIRSSVATRYQLGLLSQAACVTAPFSASTPQGTCEFAMNPAFSGAISAAELAANLALSSIRKPSCGGRIGGTGASDAPERLPLARLMLAADSTRQVRRDAISYPARQPNNNKNEQNGSKDAATNIHFSLR